MVTLRARTGVLAIAAALVTVRGPLPISAQATNPCAAALVSTPSALATLPPGGSSKYGRFGNDSRDIRELLRSSDAAAQMRARSGALEVSRPMADRDENHIAILEDRGDLITLPNPFDLANTGVRFEPAIGGYAVRVTDAAFRPGLGRRVTLGDDDSSAQTLPFGFDFYGRRFTSLFVNSDGNLTFERPDNASTERGIDRLVSGSPRIAPFFADLDPSAAGRVFVDSAADAMTVTWCAVPGFELPQTVTVQAILFPNGAIEYRFGNTDLRDTIVGLSPGATEFFNAVDLNRSGGSVDQTSAIGEQFIASAELDLVAASRRFYRSHQDDFDQLVFFTDTDVIDDAFAFEVTVKNAITGIGIERFDAASELGSGGALHSVINMDRASKYTAAPSAKIFGEISTLGILAHETGHRWLARLMFRDANRAISDQLLGRQRAHWSFFVDTDGSVMEGNEITELGGGRFQTAAATEKYSRLDLYAMGLATEAEVSPWFYLESPVASFDRDDPPLAGASITGTRRDVLIQDVVSALGPRVPAAADSPKLHRQAYVFVRRPTAFQDPQDLARIARIREQFGPFFSRATEDRMTVRTTLP